MTYTKEQFLDDVKAEAKALREHATKEELEKLDHDTFQPLEFDSCIYGQMTGNCSSGRAIELIQLCCVRYFVNDWVNIKTINDAIKCANGKKVKNLREDRNYLFLNHFSSIETYIQLEKAKTDNLIAYLRGETDDLNL